MQTKTRDSEPIFVPKQSHANRKMWKTPDNTSEQLYCKLLKLSFKIASRYRLIIRP